jgi:hypothetical protein
MLRPRVLTALPLTSLRLLVAVDRVRVGSGNGGASSNAEEAAAASALGSGYALALLLAARGAGAVVLSTREASSDEAASFVKAFAARAFGGDADVATVLHALRQDATGAAAPACVCFGAGDASFRSGGARK